MDRFITCACDKDLKALIKSGEASDVELWTAWLNIQSQHINCLSNPQSHRQIEMTMDIIEFDWRRFEIETLLYLLEGGYKADVVERMHRYDYDYEFSEDSYQEDIVKVRAELGSEALAINAMRDKLFALPDEDGNPSDNNSKQSYYNSILALQKHLGLCAGTTPMLAAKMLTVFEFDTYINQFNAMQAQLKSKKPVADVSS